MILDSTCSLKKRFPRKADVRIDINKNAHPDVLASACFLPFKSEIFDKVYCDPPHRLGRHFGVDRTKQKVKEYDRFSYWVNRDKWIHFLYRINIEFKRVLKQTGLLIFKIPDGTRSKATMIDKADLRLLTNFAQSKDKIVESHGFFAKANLKRGKSRSFVHYITFSIVSK